MAFRFFSDGIGVGRTTIRLSNIPANFTRVSHLGAACLLGAVGYALAQEADQAFFCSDMVSDRQGENPTYYFKTNQGIPYRLEMLNYIALNLHLLKHFFFTGGPEFSNYIGDIVDKLPTILEKACSATLIKNSSFSFVTSGSLDVGMQSIGRCSVAVLQYVKSEGRDHQFEQCASERADFLFNTPEVVEAPAVIMEWKMLLLMTGGVSVLLFALFFMGCVMLNRFLGRLEAASQGQEIVPTPKISHNEMKLEAINFPLSQIPREMICPMTMAIMDYPVRTAAGISNSRLPSYEASAIQLWVERRATDPHGSIDLLGDKALHLDINLQNRITTFVRDKQRLAMSARFFYYHYEPEQVEGYQPLPDLVASRALPRACLG